MDPLRAEDLPATIAVALAMVPRQVKKAYADHYDPKEHEARGQITNYLVQQIGIYLKVRANPLAAGNSTGRFPPGEATPRLD